MGLAGQVPLVSLHSISKGFVGECGRRGGYMEVTGFHQQPYSSTALQPYNPNSLNVFFCCCCMEVTGFPLSPKTPKPIFFAFCCM